jgi:hypothetical protein
MGRVNTHAFFPFVNSGQILSLFGPVMEFLYLPILSALQRRCLPFHSSKLSLIMENPPDPYTFAFPIHIWLPLRVMVSLYLGLFVYGRSITKEIAPLADNSPFFLSQFRNCF